MPKVKVKLADLVEAIHAENGNLSAVASSLGIARRTVYRYLDRWQTAKDALHEARETMLDRAEHVLHERALAGHTAELIFFLKTQGKRRGYVERQELAGAEDAPLRVEYVNDWRGETPVPTSRSANGKAEKQTV